VFDDRNSEAETLLAPDWVASAMGCGVCIGRIVRCDPSSGPVVVFFEGGGPKKARIVAGMSRDDLARAANSGREVLMLFENGDIERPIIVALMEQEAEGPPATELTKKQIGPPKQAVIDGETVKIEARNQIVLECGKGSITIRKDGKILVKGTKLVSRASETNKIKGASVNIN
jgi:hypothetical protein